MGANTALLDVCDLANAIISGANEWRNIDVLLREYENKMVPRGRTKVLESREIAESDESFDVSGGRLAQFKSSDL
jgi:2-polyprenyl-6-methoxyphenol hydroxylase-like FAD-dependent oxidoreductase